MALFSLFVPDSVVWKVSLQLVLALHRCHHSHRGGKVIWHGDLKPENGDMHNDPRSQLNLNSFLVAALTLL